MNKKFAPEPGDPPDPPSRDEVVEEYEDRDGNPVEVHQDDKGDQWVR